MTFVYLLRNGNTSSDASSTVTDESLKSKKKKEKKEPEPTVGYTEIVSETYL